MNKWLRSLPEHRAPKAHLLIISRLLTAIAVRWDPKHEDDVFLNQSAILYANYYALQITVHCVFTSTQKCGHQSFPSLAICTNAARALSHVVGIQQERTGKPLPQHIVRVFMACRTCSALYTSCSIMRSQQVSFFSSQYLAADDLGCISILRRSWLTCTSV